MSQSNIRFVYNGKTYEIPGSAYYINGPIMVVLSASEVVVLSGGWLETNPPQPKEIINYPLNLIAEQKSAAALQVVIGADYLATQVTGAEESLQGHEPGNRHPQLR